MEVKEKIMCCFIRLDGSSCEKKAEYEIVYGNSSADVTESCSSHIGELVDDRIERFEVIRISGGIREGDTVKICSAINGAPDEFHKIIRGKNGNLILDDVMGTPLIEIDPESIQKVSKEENCPVCHGKGATTEHDDPCSECGGGGKVGG